LSKQCHPSSRQLERFLQSLTRLHLAARRRRSKRKQHLSWAFASLQRILAPRVHCTQGLPRPATFRLQGLATLLTVCSPRSFAEPFSSRQRSWDFSLRSVPLSQGGIAFPQPPNPRAVSPPRSPAGRTCRPVRRTPASGLLPFRESLASARVFSPAQAGCSLGISTFQGSPTDRLARSFRPALPLRDSPGTRQAATRRTP
jgi:hypothetical protein